MMFIEFKNPDTGIWDSPMWWVRDKTEGVNLAKDIGNGREFRFVEVEVLRVFH